MPFKKYKPMPNEETERNERIWEKHIKCPQLSYEELGAFFGLSRARIGQILKRLEKEKATAAETVA
jgi:hypothetical protein